MSRGMKRAIPFALVALGLVLSVAGCKRSRPNAPPPPRAAAVVNGAPIAVTRVQAELDRMRRGSEESQAKVAPQDVPRLARALLDALVDRTIILQRAKAAGFAVTEAEVKGIKVPAEVIVGDRDPVKRMYVEPLERIRPDWPVKLVPDWNGLSIRAAPLSTVSGTWACWMTF